MDLSQLSDVDLQALQSGDLTKVSDAGLANISGQVQPDTVADVAHSALSGLGRGIPNTLDYLGSFPASLASQFTARPASPEQMRSYGLNATLIDPAIGPQYQPQTTAGEYTKAGTSGAVSTLLTPELKAVQLAKAGVTGLLGGLGGQAGGDAADAGLKDYLGDYARPVGSILGGLAGGAASATGMNVLTPKGPSIAVAPDAQTSISNAVGVVRNKAATADANVGNLYNQANAMGVGIRGPLVQGKLVPSLQDATREYSVANGGADMGLLKSAQNMAATNSNVQLNDLEVLRKAAVRGQGSQDPIVANANTQFKRSYDGFLNDITPNYLTSNQQAGVQAFQDARAARAQYGQTFEQGLNGERAALDKVVRQPNLTGAQLLDTVLNNKGAAQNVQDLMAAAGDQSGQVRDMARQSLLQKLQSDSVRQGELNPVTFRNNYTRLKEQNPELVQTLLTPEDDQVLANFGKQGLLSKIADKATGLTGEAAGAIIGHHLGGEVGAAAGVGAAGLLRIPLRAVQGSAIDNTLNGLLSRPYGAGAPAMASKGALGLRGAAASAGALGGLLATPQPQVPQNPILAPSVLPASPSVATAPAGPVANVSAADRDAAIRTMYGEARGEGQQGQAAVANVLLNRLSAGKFGSSLTDVVTAKNQFEPWGNAKTRAQLQALSPTSPEYQQLGQIFDAVASGQVPDNTNGATHFLAQAVQVAKGRKIPSWARNPLAQIGGHTFYNPDNATQMAGM